MNLKLMLSYEGVQSLRDLASSIMFTEENLKISIEQLLCTCDQIENLGVHRTNFIQLLRECKTSLVRSEEVFTYLYTSLHSIADMIEEYLNSANGWQKVKTL